MKYLSIILVLVFVHYFVTLLIFIFGNLKRNKARQTTRLSAVSVILAVKNGSKSIVNILSDFKQQDYKGKIEFQIIDDHSTDDTAELIRINIKDDSRFNLISAAFATDDLKHKKRALNLGINSSSHPILLFTDVDCRVKRNWVSGMVSYFDDNVDYVIGYSEIKPAEHPVIDGENTIVSRFQSIDYFMLLTAARAMTIWNSPWACTGRNQAYSRKVYSQTNGFSEIADCLQGDDSLYLQLARKRANVRCVFADDPGTFITGRSEPTWGKLLRQRIRWAGDANLMWRFNPIFFAMIAATFLINLLILISAVFSINYAPIRSWLFAGLFGKFVLELILYVTGTIKFGRNLRFVDFFMWFFIQIPYIVLMGLASFFAQELGWKKQK